ncbi:MAG TPA: methyltransferase domain-containing protein [Terrimicrobiaceae bacterium]
MKLDVGCGPQKHAGYLGIDITSYPGVDIVHDLNVFPWPVDSSSVERIEIRNCLEHLNNTVLVVKEMHRILRPGGEVFIEVPHFSSHDTYIDVTHTRSFSLLSFDYFRPDRAATFPRDFSFEIISRHLDFWPLGASAFKPAHLLGVQLIAKHHPFFYERFLAYIFTARSIHFLLKACK